MKTKRKEKKEEKKSSEEKRLLRRFELFFCVSFIFLSLLILHTSTEDRL